MAESIPPEELIPKNRLPIAINFLKPLAAGLSWNPGTNNELELWRQTVSWNHVTWQ
jgi:hypothetical protein